MDTEHNQDMHNLVPDSSKGKNSVKIMALRKANHYYYFCISK